MSGNKAAMSAKGEEMEVDEEEAGEVPYSFRQTMDEMTRVRTRGMAE